MLKIEKEGIRAQAAKALRQAIVSGEFLPGQRLIEAELCETLGVSRPSLREALRHLESEHLVAFIPNRGCFVAQLDWTAAHEIYEARKLLEPEIAALAAANVDEAGRAKLVQSLDDFEAAVATNDRLGQINASNDFYQAMCEAAGNGILRDILNGLNARISLLRGRSMSQPGRLEHSLNELRNIAKAILASDSLQARAMAEEHLKMASAAALSVMHEDAPRG